MIDLDKLTVIRDEICAERGELTLFALFLRERSWDRWDLVVAAPWLESGKPSLDYIASKLYAHIRKREMIFLSRIVILDDDSPAVDGLLKMVRVEGEGSAEIRDVDVGEVRIKHGYVLRAKRTPASVGK